MLSDGRCKGLHVLDLRDLEHAEAVRTVDHRTLPQMLRAWQGDKMYAEASLSDWLLARADHQDAELPRPELLAAPLHEIFDAVEHSLVPESDRQGFPWSAGD